MTTLKELRALADKATPGPWREDGPEFGGHWVVTGGAADGAVHPSMAGQPYAVLGGSGAIDAALIATMRNNLDALLDIAEAAQAMSDSLAFQNRCSDHHAHTAMMEALSRLDRAGQEVGRDE
ncbi:MAG TPA: hypothetical protein VFJ93_07750 [Gaiellaceae bacterium]|nr:hypothetical protein [Gaiellaceae bacterium]